MRNRKQDKKSKSLFVIQLICMVVFAIAAGVLIFYLHDYYKGQKTYARIEEESVKEKDDGTFVIDWDTLQSNNSDVIAWIRMNDGDISYPVVQTTDNEYYLTHSITKEENRSGAIFMDTENMADLSDDFTYIYGHNMKDKSMFAKLNYYKDKDYYENNDGFVIYTPKATYYYDIFSTYNANVVNAEFPVNFASKEEYQAYLDTITSHSNYETKIKAAKEQPVVALFTCNGNDESRRVVYGTLTKVEAQ